MKQWLRFALIGCCLICVNLIGGGNVVFGYDPWTTSNTTGPLTGAGAPVETTLFVSPALPKANDPLQIAIGGIWSDGCVPNQLSYAIVDEVISVNVTTPDAEMVCGQAESRWSLTTTVGPLPQAHYYVNIHGAITLSTTVTVAGHVVYLPAVNGR
ncbi:MAG: hypothetical protein KDE19_21805 [Caldilineaceae bacterium]|nr:hypothetical protein [Caldilineaceae bacterium]